MKKERKDFFIRSVEFRESDENSRRIEGVIPYNSDSVDMYGVTERIMPTAFNKTLADGAEVKCLFAHDVTKILGSSTNGTLEMQSRDDGLHFSFDPPDTSAGNDAYKIIKRGDCKTLSFGFVPVKTEWDESDPEHLVRKLVEVKLLEISVCVAFPAYPTGNVSARSFADKLGMGIEDLNDILSRSELSEEEKNKLSAVADKLTELTRSAAGEEPQSTPDTGTGSNSDDTSDQEAKEKEEQNKRERFAFYAQHI